MSMGDEVRHVVSFSGGLGSWCAARRVIEWYGRRNVVLLFADTKMEDEDLYRFINDSARVFDVPVTTIADGRTPWEVFEDVGIIGNTRLDPCSRILKRELIDRWLTLNCDPTATVVHVGVDWSERHRFDRMAPRKRAVGWTYHAPMIEAPYLTKKDMLAEVEAHGIKPPRLYAMGFPHNNCGGFCVKAGQGSFIKLLEQLPERFDFHAAKERDFMARRGGMAILRDRRGGGTRPLTLHALKDRVRAGGEVDRFEFGGCGCAIDDPDEDDEL